MRENTKYLLLKMNSFIPVCINQNKNKEIKHKTFQIKMN